MGEFSFQLHVPDNLVNFDVRFDQLLWSFGDNYQSVGQYFGEVIYGGTQLSIYSETNGNPSSIANNLNSGDTTDPSLNIYGFASSDIYGLQSLSLTGQASDNEIQTLLVDFGFGTPNTYYSANAVMDNSVLDQNGNFDVNIVPQLWYYSI